MPQIKESIAIILSRRKKKQINNINNNEWFELIDHLVIQTSFVSYFAIVWSHFIGSISSAVSVVDWNKSALMQC